MSKASDNNIVTARPRIGHLLMRLMETRAPLTMTFAGGHSPSNTVLLKLDLQGGEMVLDDPYPPQPTAALTKASLRGRVEGSLVEFDVNLLQPLKLGGMQALRVSMPSSLEHSERRAGFRLQIPPDLFLPPTTFTNREGAFRGRLLDVSESGAGSSIQAVEGNAEIGAVLACALSLPGTRLLADVEVCSVAGAGKEGRRLGLKFANLSSAQRAAMTRAVASLDRQLIRRYASAAWV